MTFRFEIFNAGEHTSSQNTTRTWTVDELDQVVSTYNPNVFKAPLIVSMKGGHDTGGIPDKALAFSELAFGFPKYLERQGSKLYGVFEKISSDFVEWIKEGRILDRSASFYKPDSPNNPYPGKWSLRHVAALGKTPPAVKGMEDLSGAFSVASFALDFSEEEDCEDYTCEMCGAVTSLHAIAQMFQRQREQLIEDKDIETADRVFPAHLLTMLQREADAQARSASISWEDWDRLVGKVMALSSQMSSQGKAIDPYYGEGMKNYKKMLADAGVTSVEGIESDVLEQILDGSMKPSKPQKAMIAKALGIAEDELEMSEATDQDLLIAELQRKVAAMEAEKTRSTVQSFIENLSSQSQRRVLPAQVGEFVEFALSLDDSTPIDFAEGTASKATARQRYLTQLASGPQLWGGDAKVPTSPSDAPAFSESKRRPRLNDTINYDEASERLHEKIVATIRSRNGDPLDPATYAEVADELGSQMAA